MEKIQKIGLLILLNIFPSFLLVLHIPDTIEAINSPGAYPFGDSINPSGSIYTSQTSYVTYNIVSILFLVLLIAFSFLWKKYQRAYLSLVVINFLLFVYPIISSRD